MIRSFVMLLAAVALAACTQNLPSDPLEDLGAFKLGYNIVVADKMKKGPVSRDATKEEWVSVMTKAMDDRFSRYQGDQLYHFGISIEGYMLAPGGVPVLYSPKSALIIRVTVWDDAAGKKLNSEAKQFTIFETTTSDSVIIGSGHDRTREEQMIGLSNNAVDAIEDWMVEQHKQNGWFAPRPKPEGESVATEPDAAAG